MPLFSNLDQDFLVDPSINDDCSLPSNAEATKLEIESSIDRLDKLCTSARSTESLNSNLSIGSSSSKSCNKKSTKTPPNSQNNSKQPPVNKTVSSLNSSSKKTPSAAQTEKPIDPNNQKLAEPVKFKKTFNFLKNRSSLSNSYTIKNSSSTDTPKKAEANTSKSSGKSAVDTHKPSKHQLKSGARDSSISSSSSLKKNENRVLLVGFLASLFLVFSSVLYFLMFDDLS